MKNLLLCLFVLASFYCKAESEFFIRRETGAKIKEPDLSFAVTFDRHSVNADFAKGNGECQSGKNTNLALRGTIGFDGQQGFSALPGEELAYAAVGNASPHNGTISFWLNARDFDPAKDTGRGNMALLSMKFMDGGRWINYVIYEYKGSLWADWKSSEPPHNWSDTCTLSMPAKMHQLKQNRYFQIVYTWKNSNEVALYCNGKKIMSKMLPVKWKKTAELKADAKSKIILRPNILADNKQATMEMDDVLIYSRALTPLEVANHYRSLLKNPDRNEKVQLFTVKLNGVDRGYGKDNGTLEAEFDFSGVPLTEKEKGIKLSYSLTGPEEFHLSGEWNFKKDETLQYLSGIQKAGKYTLAVQYKNEKFSTEIVRPDMSFLGNRLGKEGVPALWKEFRADGRTVTTWNRRYFFGKGPFPEKILVGGENLLEQVPTLVINGKNVSDWESGTSEAKERSVIYTGQGRFPGGTLRYRTEVAFDGLIDCRFAIDGKPSVEEMHLEWKVAKPYTQYLMVPELYEKITNPAKFDLNYSTDRAQELWFVTEKKGGFCWSLENDANWVYSPADKILSADIKTGRCVVQMINKKSTIPEGAEYNALFIATPVRPLPKKIRNLRWGGHELSLAHGLFGYFTSPTAFEPHPTEFERQMKAYPKNCLAANGLADSMTAIDPAAVYFEKYCEKPGASNYDIPYRRLVDGKLVMEHYRTISTCNRSFVNDLFLWNIQKLLTHPYGDRFAMIYYDLCGYVLCRNELHGCRFRDKFGRWIDSSNILTKRDLVIRTVAYCHAQNRQVFLHGQRSYFPMMQGCADYWFPGEEHTALFMRNPFGATDEISDKIYRSEFNRDVRGIGCIVLPAVTMNSKVMSDPAQKGPTEAYVGMLLLHDVEFWGDQLNKLVYNKVYGIKKKYHFEDAEALPYYTENGVKSTEQDLRVTRYTCPEGVNLLVIMNKEPRKRTGTIDCSSFSSYSGKITEEYAGEELTAEKGKFTITVPARAFRIVPIR